MAGTVRSIHIFIYIISGHTNVFIINCQHIHNKDPKKIEFNS